MVLRNSRRHAARHFVHLSCTILLGFIGAASSGSFPSTGDHIPTGFLRAGNPAQHQPDLVADTASGLPLRDALLQAAAGAGIDRAKSPGGCDSDGHLWTPRCLIAVRGRHCSGDRDALSIAPPGNISLLGSRGAAIDCPVVLGAPPESASGPAAPGARPFDFVFFGNGAKGGRPGMLAALARALPTRAVVSSAGFLGRGTVGSGSMAAPLLRQAAFCPTPCGFEHPDSFRYPHSSPSHKLVCGNHEVVGETRPFP